jgi:Ca2+-binding RTX toxin-like protein
LQQNIATDDFGNIDTVRNFENAIGSDFDDVLISNDNGNTLLGRDGNDTLAGGLGDDVIEGGTGDDLLRGELNDRTPQGAIKGGDDLIRGGVGNDLIGGKAGNDRLFGDEGEDRIWGDDGDDLLFGGLDNDILTGDDSSGGQGSDTFVLAIGHGTDTITDFEVGTDLIGLVGDLTFGQLSVTQIDNATQIAFGDEVLAVLDRVEVGTLTESSFTSNTNWI